MKKLIAAGLIGLLSLPAMADTINCGKGNTKAEKMACRWTNNKAPEYFTGCFDYAAPEVGAKKAAEICLAEYEQHKHNKKAGVR